MKSFHLELFKSSGKKCYSYRNIYYHSEANYHNVEYRAALFCSGVVFQQLHFKKSFCESVEEWQRVCVKTATCQTVETPPVREAGRPTGFYMSVRALGGQRRSHDLLLTAWCRSEASQLVSHLFPLFSTWTLGSAVLVSLFPCPVALWLSTECLFESLGLEMLVGLQCCGWSFAFFSLAYLPSSFRKYLIWLDIF